MPDIEEFSLEDFQAAPVATPTADEEFSLTDFEPKPPATPEEAFKFGVEFPLEMTTKVASAVSAGLGSANWLTEQQARQEADFQRMQPKRVVAPGAFFPMTAPEVTPIAQAPRLGPGAALRARKRGPRAGH